MSSDQKPSRPATWDEIETGFHEYAADLTRQELGLGGGTSYPPDFADWRVGMRAAQEWLAAHDARVRRDAARSALNGYADALDNNRHAAVWGWHDFVRDAREWASENYPEETP